jgi:hypothetical protein
MTDNKQLALEYLGLKPEQVLKYREVGEEIIVVADLGIAGCPKYHIPQSKLVAHDAPLPFTDFVEEEEEEEIEEYPDIDLEIDEMGYRELQAMAKEQGIQANQSRETLLQELGLMEDE